MLGLACGDTNVINKYCAACLWKKGRIFDFLIDAEAQPVQGLGFQKT
jgi:hypothetical protein